MLVLSRRKDETIMIGDSVEITIVDIRGDTVRLGITAPRTVSVHRKEIYDAIQQENIAAAKEGPADQGSVGGLGSLLKGATLGGLSGLAGSKSPKAAGLSGLSKLSGNIGGAPDIGGNNAAPKINTRAISKFAENEGPQKKKQ